MEGRGFARLDTAHRRPVWRREAVYVETDPTGTAWNELWVDDSMPDREGDGAWTSEHRGHCRCGRLVLYVIETDRAHVLPPEPICSECIDRMTEQEHQRP